MIKCSDKICKCVISLKRENNYINRFIYKKCFKNKSKYEIAYISVYMKKIYLKKLK